MRFSKKKHDELQPSLHKEVTISLKLLLAQMTYLVYLKYIFKPFKISTVCILSDNNFGSYCHFFDENHKQQFFSLHI